MLRRIQSLMLVGGALAATAQATMAGVKVIEPETSGGDGAAIVVALAIGVILIATLNSGPKPDPETTDSDE